MPSYNGSSETTGANIAHDTVRGTPSSEFDTGAERGRWHERLATRVGAFVFVGTLLPTWLLVGWMTLAEQVRLPDEAEHHVEDMALLIAAEITRDLQEADAEMLRGTMEQLLRDELQERHFVAMRQYVVLDAEGREVASGGEGLPVDDLLQGPSVGLRWTGQRLIHRAHLVSLADGTSYGQMALSFDGTPVLDLVRRGQWSALLWSMLALCFAGTLAVATGRRIARPLEVLKEQAGHVGSGAVDVSGLQHAPFEVRQLAWAIRRADRDIERATSQLDAQQKLFRAVLDNSPTVVYLRDMEGRYVLVNRQFEKLFGVSEAQVKGRTDAEVFDAVQLRPPPSTLDGFSPVGPVLRRVNFAPEGGYLHHLVAEFPLVDASGHMTGAGAIATDITHQIRSEDQALRLAAIVEQAHEAIVVTGTDGRIEYVNAAFVTMCGYPKSELIGRSPRILKSGRHSEDYYKAMWDTLIQDGRWHGDFTNRRKDGSLFEIEQSVVTLVDAQGEVSGYVGLSRNVTEQRAMARRLRHADRVKSLGVLAGGIAHDFNNLLTAILGNAAMARQMEAREDIGECLDDIEVASRSAADLCQQMLAYSGKGRFVVRRVDVSAVVRDIGNLLRVSVSKNVRVDYHLGTRLRPVHADVAQIQQVVLNLLTNASESIGDESGQVTLSTFERDFDEQELSTFMSEHTLLPGTYVAIEVRDTGCGMDADVLRRIFDPFFTTKFHGRGLGMSAMLGIVQGHGGGVRIDSAVGVGTTVLVLFPPTEVDVEDTHDAAPKASWTPSGTVLVIDDEAPVRKVVGQMLEALGFDVVVASGGHEGLRLFDEHRARVVLVVLDMTMPEMDGVTCLRLLRERSQKIPVVVASGYAHEHVLSRFVQDRPSGFLRKPFVPDALEEAVRAALLAT